jgi:hypothetical protein
MIRKLLVIAAAVAMPASALAAVTTIGVAGPAGAVAKVYTSQTCALTGQVTFAKPGLSYNGSVSAATVSKAKSAATETGAGCGKITLLDPTGTVNVSKSTITTASTDCNIPPVPPATLPGACANETLTKHYAYDYASALASSGVSSIVSSLSATGIHIVDNHNAVVGQVTSGGTSEVLPGTSCGTDVGFELSGNALVAGVPVPGLTYDLLLCIVGDTGTSGPLTSGTTGSFYNDYIAALGGNAGITIATGIFGGSSLLTFTKV